MELPRSSSVTPAQVDFAIQYNDGQNCQSNSVMSENFHVAMHSSSFATYRQGHNTSIPGATSDGATAIGNGTDAYGDNNTWSNTRESRVVANPQDSVKRSDSQMGFNMYHREGQTDSGYQSVSHMNHPCGTGDFRSYLDYDGGATVMQEGTVLHGGHRPTQRFDVNSAVVGTISSSRLETVPSSESIRLRELLEHSVKEVEAAASAIDTLVFNFNNDIKNIFHDLTSRLESSNSQWLAGEQLTLTKDLGALEHELGELRTFVDSQSKATVAKDNLIDNLRNILGKERQRQDVLRGYGDEQTSKHEVFQSHVSEWTYCQHLKRRVFQALRAQAQAGSRARWEAACKQRAEEVCHQLEERFQATKVKLDGKIEQLKSDKMALMNEKGEYENTVQQALMRGLCSLNMEALKVLNINKIDELNVRGENGDNQAADSPQPADETTSKFQDAVENPPEEKDSGTEIYGCAVQPIPNRYGQRSHSSRYVLTAARPSNHHHYHHPSASPSKIPRKPALINNKRKN